MEWSNTSKNASLFELAARCALVEQASINPNDFGRLPNQQIYTGKRKFVASQSGMKTTMAFYRRRNPLSQLFRALWQQVCRECYHEPYDGCNFSTLELDVLMHGDPVAPGQVTGLFSLNHFL